MSEVLSCRRQSFEERNKELSQVSLVKLVTVNEVTGDWPPTQLTRGRIAVCY